MNHRPRQIGTPFELLRPTRQLWPLVLASPHSGRCYAEDLLALSQLDEPQLRQSEDCFVDELFGAAPSLGVPLLAANFPRVFVDANREIDEIDFDMFVGALPGASGQRNLSPRVLAGLGVIPRLSSADREIYSGKLPYAEAERRLDLFYRPYHAALERLIAETKERFGCCVLLDCHSMPSMGGPDAHNGRRQISVDYVLGDCFGASCADAITQSAETALASLGAKTRRNSPYSGGYVAQRYGKPAGGIHVLQIEINRALYMDEASLERHRGFAEVRAAMGRLVQRLSQSAAALAHAG
jgi:N-formylglutamate amidohydrolase